MDGTTDEAYVAAVRRVRARHELATALAVTRELGLSADAEGSDLGTVRGRLDQLVADGRLASGKQDWQFMASVLPSATGETYYWPMN